jgi:hypothetical protein
LDQKRQREEKLSRCAWKPTHVTQV